MVRWAARGGLPAPAAGLLGGCCCEQELLLRQLCEAERHLFATLKDNRQSGREPKTTKARALLCEENCSSGK